MSVWQHCDRCGVGRCLGIGYNALALTRVERLATLIKMGWQVAPTFLCTNCRPAGLFVLVHHPESSCIFWDTELGWQQSNGGDGMCVEVGKSKWKSLHEAARIWREFMRENDPGTNINDAMEYFRVAYKP